jgi:uncharacterized Rmd1/YagE family protein
VEGRLENGHVIAMNEQVSLSLRHGTRLTGSPDFVKLGSLPAATPLIARARLLGARIDTRDVATDATAAALATDVGLTFVFRYGVVVTIGAGSEPTHQLDSVLLGYVVDPTQIQEVESATLEGRPDGGDRIGPDGQIQLVDMVYERLLLTAIVLARSVVLARDEILVSEAYDRIGPLVTDLRENGRARLPIRPAMQLVGNVLAARHRLTGTAQVDERPDLLWDHPQLDRLYVRLEAEYELKERAEVVVRKFGALGDFTEVLLDIVQDKRAFRVEIAIIALIAFEILLTLFNMVVS